jgi:hypothetical protein
MTEDERRALLMKRTLLKPAEAAFLIRRDKSTITRWIQQGLDVVELRGIRYVRADEVRRWAADPDRRSRRKP